MVDALQSLRNKFFKISGQNRSSNVIVVYHEYLLLKINDQFHLEIYSYVCTINILPVSNTLSVLNQTDIRSTSKQW